MDESFLFIWINTWFINCNMTAIVLIVAHLVLQA